MLGSNTKVGILFEIDGRIATFAGCKCESLMELEYLDKMLLVINVNGVYKYENLSVYH